MIDKTSLSSLIEGSLVDSEMFLVDVIINPGNAIVVEVDSKIGVSIDECIKITRLVEENFDRDKEDYELEVGSAGLTSPFKVVAQYEKNIGNDVEVLTADGQKIKGLLKAANQAAFTIVVSKKVKLEGAKRPTVIEEDLTFQYSEIKYTKYLMQFK